MSILTPTPKTIQNLIRVIPDHPRPGVLYQDMASVFNAPRGMQDVMTLFRNYISDNNIKFNRIVGLDARGFPMAGALSSETGVPFSMARKKGKLPGETIFTEYELEYGTDELHLQIDAINKDDQVIIVDDLLATGGTVAACTKLCEKAGARVIGSLFVIELDGLDGRTALSPIPTDSIIEYPA